MNNLNNQHRKDQVYQRILQTIATKKRKTRQRYMLSGVMIMALLCVLSYFQFRLPDLSDPPQQTQLYADISTGSVSINGEQTQPLQEVESRDDLPLRIRRDSDMMIIQSNQSAHAKADEITLRVGVGGLYKVILDDGSVVFLNSQSELRYRGDLMENRQVHLKGEAYFDIAKKEVGSKKQPFTVRTDQQEIKVLGTQFNVLSRTDQEETILTEGKVELKSVKKGIQKILTPGEMVQLASDGSLTSSHVSIDEYTAWKDGIIYFEDRSLVDILAALKHIYPIDFKPSTVPQKYFTVYLKRDRPFSDVLAMIKESGDLNVQMDGRKITFSK